MSSLSFSSLSLSSSLTLSKFDFLKVWPSHCRPFYLLTTLFYFNRHARIQPSLIVNCYLCEVCLFAGLPKLAGVNSFTKIVQPYGIRTSTRPFLKPCLFMQLRYKYIHWTSSQRRTIHLFLHPRLFKLLLPYFLFHHKKSERKLKKIKTQIIVKVQSSRMWLWLFFCILMPYSQSFLLFFNFFMKITIIVIMVHFLISVFVLFFLCHLLHVFFCLVTRNRSKRRPRK